MKTSTRYIITTILAVLCLASIIAAALSSYFGCRTARTISCEPWATAISIGSLCLALASCVSVYVAFSCFAACDYRDQKNASREYENEYDARQQRLDASHTSYILGLQGGPDPADNDVTEFHVGNTSYSSDKVFSRAAMFASAGVVHHAHAGSGNTSLAFSSDTTTASGHTTLSSSSTLAYGGAAHIHTSASAPAIGDSENMHSAGATALSGRQRAWANMSLDLEDREWARQHRRRRMQKRRGGVSWQQSVGSNGGVALPVDGGGAHGSKTRSRSRSRSESSSSKYSALSDYSVVRNGERVR